MIADALRMVWLDAHEQSLRATMNDNHIEGLKRMLGMSS